MRIEQPFKRLPQEIPPREFRASPKLESRLRAAVALGNQDELKRVREAYREQYPDEHEAIEALFGFVWALHTQHTIEELRARDGKAPFLLYRNQTEYNFLLTHFVKTTGEKRFLADFWDLLESVARARDAESVETLGKLKAGVVAQVAIAKAFEALGEETAISHPDEDALQATDLWVESHPIQVKGAHTESPAFVPTDEIDFPTIAIRHGKRTRHYAPPFSREFSDFRFKIREYGERIGKPVEGYFVVVPYKMIDRDTGDPSPALIEYFREHAPDSPRLSSGEAVRPVGPVREAA